MASEQANRKESLSQFVHVTCDGCRSGPIQHRRHKCLDCENFDFCESCFKDHMKKCKAGPVEESQEAKGSQASQSGHNKEHRFASAVIKVETATRSPSLSPSEDVMDSSWEMAGSGSEGGGERDSETAEETGTTTSGMETETLTLVLEEEGERKESSISERKEKKEGKRGSREKKEEASASLSSHLNNPLENGATLEEGLLMEKKLLEAFGKAVSECEKALQDPIEKVKVERSTALDDLIAKNALVKRFEKVLDEAKKSEETYQEKLEKLLNLFDGLPQKQKRLQLAAEETLGKGVDKVGALAERVLEMTKFLEQAYKWQRSALERVEEFAMSHHNAWGFHEQLPPNSGSASLRSGSLRWIVRQDALVGPDVPFPLTSGELTLRIGGQQCSAKGAPSILFGICVMAEEAENMEALVGPDARPFAGDGLTPLRRMERAVGVRIITSAGPPQQWRFESVQFGKIGRLGLHSDLMSIFAGRHFDLRLRVTREPCQSQQTQKRGGEGREADNVNTQGEAAGGSNDRCWTRIQILAGGLFSLLNVVLPGAPVFLPFVADDRGGSCFAFNATIVQ